MVGANADSRQQHARSFEARRAENGAASDRMIYACLSRFTCAPSGVNGCAPSTCQASVKATITAAAAHHVDLHEHRPFDRNQTGSAIISVTAVRPPNYLTFSQSRARSSRKEARNTLIKIDDVIRPVEPERNPVAKVEQQPSVIGSEQWGGDDHAGDGSAEQTQAFSSFVSKLRATPETS